MADGSPIMRVQGELPGLRPATPSTTDTSVQLNAVQCRYELHRALDCGGEADLAAWARRWGEDLAAFACTRKSYMAY